MAYIFEEAFIIWYNICSNVFIFIVLEQYLCLLENVDITGFYCRHLKYENKCTGYRLADYNLYNFSFFK